MVISLSILTLCCLFYLTYLLHFQCRTKKTEKILKSVKITDLEKIPGLKVIKKPKTHTYTFKKELEVQKHPQRVTAIRVGEKPGLYNNGIYIDSFKKSSKYVVEELIHASDNACYTYPEFFRSELELKNALSTSEHVYVFNSMITEELLK